MDKHYHSIAQYLLGQMHFWAMLVPHTHSFSSWEYSQHCITQIFGQARMQFIGSPFEMLGYDTLWDKDAHYLAFSLCSFFALKESSLYSLQWHQDFLSASSRAAYAWFDNIAAQGRVWECTRYKSHREELFPQVSSRLGLQWTSPKLLTFFFCECLFAAYSGKSPFVLHCGKTSRALLQRRVFGEWVLCP